MESSTVSAATDTAGQKRSKAGVTEGGKISPDREQVLKRKLRNRAARAKPNPTNGAKGSGGKTEKKPAPPGKEKGGSGGKQEKQQTALKSFFQSSNTPPKPTAK